MIRGLILLLSLLFATGAVLADERILRYDIEVDVRADGSLDVVEHITVRVEGSNIRRGIYRDFPTRYKDRYGNAVVVDLDVLGVERDGRAEPWFTERMSNGVRINTGNDDLLPVPADYRYSLRYRTTRQLGFFADHDELYWNAIGTGWMFAIDAAEVQVRLPQAVPVAQLRAEGYTGPQGGKGQDYRSEVPAPGLARWQLTQALAPNEGLTIVLSFPKGLIAEPTRLQRGLWLLKDNRGVLIALASLFALLTYCVRRWRQVGRDPRAGVVIARYQPPEGHSPAGVRFMRRMAYDNRCFSADLLALAVAGKLGIHRDKGWFKDDWHLEKSETADANGAVPAADTLFQRLFARGKKRLDLDSGNATTIAAAKSAHDTALDRQYQPALFQRNSGSIAIAFLIILVGIGAAMLLSGGAGILLIIAISVVMLIILAVFGRLVRAPTPAGRQLLDEIEGLKLYLSVAERDELASMQGPGAPPPLDAKRYEALLPYAVALEVEDAWTDKFTVAVGAAAAAAATAGIAWYHGSQISDLGSLSKAVGSSLSSQIASSSSPPGSSSGSGGGGSSGGGGGGGGGGGR